MATVRAMARCVLAGLTVGAAAIALAPAASASITPALTLDQRAGTRAGSTVSLGTDLKFAPTGSDSPKDLTLSLPAGLLANASIDGGACLRSHTELAACQVGSGTVTAAALGLLPVSLPVRFYLVAPPKAGDLAGLAILVNVLGLTSQLGTPADITVRSVSDPAGVGLNIAFTNIPNTSSGVPVSGIPGLPISVDELQATLSGLRLPTSCPTAPASVKVTADSYNDPTQRTASAPLHVTGCSSLPYAPAFHITAAKDSGDAGVRVTTDITQPATPVQATSRAVRLTFPAAVLFPNVAAVLGGGILCADPASGTCKPIGTASSTSPLYPTPLSGTDYLTGSLAAPAIAIVFPAPFALTLEGKVDLATNSTTFDNVPDIPLTDLGVTLAGGADAVFETSCSPASGTAAGTLTSQNGDHTAIVSSPFTVSGCTTPAGGGGAPQPKGPPPGTPGGKSGRPARARISSLLLTGLARGRPTLSFKLLAGTNAPKITSFTVELPRGLSFVKRRVHHRQTVLGVSVAGAAVRSITLEHGHLVVTLARPAGSLVVKIGTHALAESAGLEKRAKRHRIRTLKVTVVIKNATGKRTTVSAVP